MRVGFLQTLYVSRCLCARGAVESASVLELSTIYLCQFDQELCCKCDQRTIGSKCYQIMCCSLYGPETQTQLSDIPHSEAITLAKKIYQWNASFLGIRFLLKNLTSDLVENDDYRV